MLDIALRNLWRNGRRSVATGASIAVGCLAVALFASFSANVTNGLQTETVGRMGHLSIYKRGYFASGGGNTGAYGIPGYRALIDRIAKDRELRPLIRVVTPTVTVGGIASSQDADASTTFLAQGVVAADRRKMATWNEHKLPLNADALTVGVPDGAADSGVVGAGLARILKLCFPQETACTRVKTVETPKNGKAAVFASLAEQEKLGSQQQGVAPVVNLLAATSGGAPNVIRMQVLDRVPLGVKDLDDRYVGLPLALAQSLLFGRTEPQATAIVVQLHSTASLRAARAHLNRLVAAAGLPLEVLDFTVLSPSYRQVNEFYGTLSACLMLIFCTVALFMTMNTMSTSVHERTREIGTLRALGMDRGPLRRLFVAEGVMLGTMGATLGVALAAALIFGLNHAGLSWMPPGSLRPVPMRFSFSGALPTIAALWVLLVLSAALAARLAAAKAARMRVVDALRQS